MRFNARGTFWSGWTVFRYEVTDIIPDHNISRAMDLQAAAEREKRQVGVKFPIRHWHSQ